LHAHVLGFAHPTTGEAVSFRSPLPADLTTLRAALKAPEAEEKQDRAKT
jgi:23S rRNA pseudouridine1911/1915/1917 synthase